MADPALRAELGAAGVERARAHYSWRCVAERTLEAYAAVVRPSVAVKEALR